MEEHNVALQYAAAIARQAEIVETINGLRAEDAPLQFALPEAERRRINDLALYRGLLGPFQTLDSRVDSWRDFLDQALSALSPEAREHVMEIVAQLDERFLTTTREVPDPVQRPQPWQAQGWWWFRAPARMEGLAR